MTEIRGERVLLRPLAEDDIAPLAEMLGDPEIELPDGSLIGLIMYSEERGHHRLTIDPTVGNERAIAAYRKVGFKPVGVMREYERGADGIWRDGLLMDLLAWELR